MDIYVQPLFMIVCAFQEMKIPTQVRLAQLQGHWGYMLGKEVGTSTLS